MDNMAQKMKRFLKKAAAISLSAGSLHIFLLVFVTKII